MLPAGFHLLEMDQGRRHARIVRAHGEAEQRHGIGPRERLRLEQGAGAHRPPHREKEDPCGEHRGACNDPGSNEKAAEGHQARHVPDSAQRAPHGL